MDASFKDGDEKPLRLIAADGDDVSVLSALIQDAVGKVGNVRWSPRRRRFSLLLYRFRWEDAGRAAKQRRNAERVAAALTIDDVTAVRRAGVDPADKEAVLSVLSLAFTPGEEGSGTLRLTCSGGAMMEFDVEAVNVELVDLTRPWAAGGTPQHF